MWPSTWSKTTWAPASTTPCSWLLPTGSRSWRSTTSASTAPTGVGRRGWPTSTAPRGSPAGAGSVILLWGEPGGALVDLTHLKQPAGDVGPLRVFHDHATGI